PRAWASGPSVPMSGNPSPRSQRLTALSVTCSCSARALWVRPRSRRVRAKKAPKDLASMAAPPFFAFSIARRGQKVNRRSVYLPVGLAERGCFVVYWAHRTQGGITVERNEWLRLWKEEENAAHIHGWDF